MGKARAIVALVLVVAGVGLLAYGLFHNSITVFSKPAAEPVVVTLDDEPGAPSPSVPAVAQPKATSEPAVVQEVARGGVTRDASSGQIKQTYEEGKQAPKACPT